MYVTEYTHGSNGIKIHVTSIRHIISVEQAHPPLYGGRFPVMSRKKSSECVIWILLQNDVGVEAARGPNMGEYLPSMFGMSPSMVEGQGRERLVIWPRGGDFRAMGRRGRCAEK